MSKHLHTWRKACNVRGIGFTPEQQAAGWPESIDIGRIARLQSPDDLKGERIIYAGLLADCESGQLPNVKTTRTKQKPWSKTIPVTFASSKWTGVKGETHTVHGVTDVAVDTYHVTAPALKTWLGLIGEPRSHHIDAWLDAVGVAAAIEHHTNEADSVRWTDERKTEARAMVDRLRGAGTRAYVAETAKHYGVSATRLREVLKDGNTKPVKLTNSIFALPGKTHRMQ